MEPSAPLLPKVLDCVMKKNPLYIKVLITRWLVGWVGRKVGFKKVKILIT